MLDVKTLQILTGFSLTSLTYVPSSLSAAAAGGSGEEGAGGATKAISYYGNQEERSQSIAGLTVVAGPQSSPQSLYVMATTSEGRCVRVNVGKALASGKRNEGPLLTTDMSTQFFYHVGTIEGLCTSHNLSKPVIATAGCDKRICVWDVNSKQLISRYITKLPVKSIAFDHTGGFVAAGYDITDKLAAGSLTTTMGLFSLVKSAGKGTGDHPSEFPFTLIELSSYKDAKENIMDVKFSPDNTKLAAGSGDNFIYVYSCTYEGSTCRLTHLHKLAGHSSFVTHLGICIHIYI